MCDPRWEPAHTSTRLLYKATYTDHRSYFYVKHTSLKVQLFNSYYRMEWTITNTHFIIS